MNDHCGSQDGPRRWQVRVLALLSMLGLVDTAHACVSSYYNPRSQDKVHETYPDVRERRMGQLAWVLAFERCVGGDMFDVEVRLDWPGAVYVGDITYMGNTYPAYEVAPDSPLLIFLFQRIFGFQELPLRPGGSHSYPVTQVPDGQVDFNFRPQYFSRGGRMRSVSGSGNFSWKVAKYPNLNGDFALDYSFTFPITTCPLQDTAATLQDVQVAELSMSGSTAREKLVAIRMDCGIDPPRARMTLNDAGDAGNSGSQLTPTADSDAEGVRVQLLRNGSEVTFGQAWTFEPAVGGVHDHPFTVRYIRTSEPLVPGVIKGEAVLNVDYW
jgi:type 1 fimbria pilin